MGRNARLAALAAGIFVIATSLVLTSGDDDGGPNQLTRPVKRVLEAGRGICGDLVEIALPGGLAACSHGPDPAPPGVDIGDGFDPLAPPGAPGHRPPRASAGAAPVCEGDGRSGPRIQAIYGRSSDVPDRYDQVVGHIRNWAADMDSVFAASAARHGGDRRVRFVTDASCNVTVERVTFGPGGDDNLGNTMAELGAQGFTAHDRKYLVWMDAAVICGEAAYYPDDAQSPDNANNGPRDVPGLVGRVDTGCWGRGLGNSVEAHELMHMLGAVVPGAPNVTPRGHCTQESDLMCYDDGGVAMQTGVCPVEQEGLFDCGADDYFDPTPAPGSWLATHWNTAQNRFLIGAP